MGSHLEFIRRYLDAIEQGRVVGNESDWYAADAVQVEFPNKLQPKGATRTLADLKRAGESGAKIV
ncbi:MAG TPA: hypothetical protein VGP93_17170, partial [Polyangiaceae bacterium]|nr:hypothetical protein [Polyangiaceae bacterium]